MAESFQPKFVDLVRNYTESTGTGNLVLGAPVAGFTSFTAALMPGDSFYYSALSMTDPSESEVGRGTLQDDGSIARAPIGAGPTNFSAGTKTVALVAAAEWFNDMDLAGSRRKDPLQFGATGDGISDDAPALDAALEAVADGNILEGVGGKSYDLATWSGHAPAGKLALDLRGARFIGPADQKIFVNSSDFDVQGGTFDSFYTAFENVNRLAPAGDMQFIGSHFRTGRGNGVINFESPFDRLLVAFGRFENSSSVQVRGGWNDNASQAGWRGFASVFNTFLDVQPESDPESASSVSATLTYSPGARIVGNFVDGLTGGKNAETNFFYTKAKHGLVALNYATNPTLTPGGSGNFYGINLKGAVRAVTSAPQGYGAMALGNHLVSGGTGVAVQMQADEQAIVANNFDGFYRGIEYSGGISGSIIALNRGYGAGAASEKATAGGVSGSAVLAIGNIHRNFITGIEYSCVNGDTLDRLSIIGQHVQGIGPGSGGAGLAVTGGGIGNVTDVLVADTSIRGFTAGANFTQVHGLTLSNISFADVANLSPAQRAYQFINCKRIVGRRAQTTSVRTTSASATALTEIQLSNENIGVLNITVCSRRTDGTAREVIEAKCPFYMEGGTLTLGTPAVTNMFGTGITVTFIVVSGVRIRAQVVAAASETWDHFAVVDFTIQ